MTLSPLILAVAPNGARKTKDDHPAVPITAFEIADTAKACQEAGAAMIHLHVRTASGEHSLDVDLYKEATQEIRKAVGDKLIIQATSEQVGIYTSDEQIDMVKRLRPEAVSLGIRELCPDAQHEKAFADLTSFMAREAIAPQFILYDEGDVERFSDLQARGFIQQDTPFVLFVLGRYSTDLTSTPDDLLPFINAREKHALKAVWAVCAFGPKEAACGLSSAALGGHVRVGFENNLKLALGDVAPNNEALVGQIAEHTYLMGRSIASAEEARSLLGMQ